ncbi:DUF6524 family protein [Seohaeicola zhoushanensis]|uniref:Uncharacterized protein n=1 Tax=Seohaeicola zhoushanensis TaxID=1569283 RepID=A0A8J3H104_9RHOB|nr:DUF6524 family protein [Seohaeicola zhoushanensis]GHF61272.1 hypothetical protein GCM10017056_35890 [Seohaeicola zhoushanensis]
MGFILRWLFALLLLSATYNPTQFNFVSWAMDGQDRQWSVVALSGLVLLIGYIIYLRATLRSIGPFGMILILALVAAILWVLYDFGLLTLDDRSLNVWIGILALSLVLGVGMGWSHVRRMISGQSDMDDVDE